MWGDTPKARILTPCIGVCTVGQHGFCEGCFRTLDEIASWARLAEHERLAIMNEVLPARETACAS
jgi:hypothetical protein